MIYNPQRLCLPTSLRAPGRVLPRVRHAFSALLGCALLSAFVAGGSAASHAAQTRFTLTSPTIRNGALVPVNNVGERDSCHGGNQSPPLAWSHAPEGTQSYAISMADLDAKVGVVWLWLMFNLPANVTALPENAAQDKGLAPSGTAQARNGFDETGYSGPCPRKGAPPHHYLITVWALNTAHLAFKDGTPAQPVAIFLRRHSLGHANLTPRYGDR